MRIIAGARCGELFYGERLETLCIAMNTFVEFYLYVHVYLYFYGRSLKRA